MCFYLFKFFVDAQNILFSFNKFKDTLKNLLIIKKIIKFFFSF